MTTVSYTKFRKNLALFLTRVDEDCEEIVVHRGKGRNAVLLSEDEYSSLLETAYLLSTPKNRRHLQKSLKEAKEGKTVKVSF